MSGKLNPIDRALASFVRVHVARTFFAVALSACLIGCGSGNKSYEQGMKTGSSLQELAQDMAEGEKQMDTTLACGHRAGLERKPMGSPMLHRRIQPSSSSSFGNR